MSPAQFETFGVIDIGSTKIVCLIGCVESDLTIRVLGLGWQKARGVRNGGIVDIEEAALAIRASVDEAQNIAATKLRAVTVNLSSGQPESQLFDVQWPVGGRIVEGRDVQGAVSEVRTRAAVNGRESIHSLPIAFSVDGTDHVVDPRGFYCTNLGIRLHIISADATALRSLQACIDRCGLKIDEFVSAPLASGLATLVSDERELGVTLVEMGGCTTGIAVFINGQLLHAAQIPVGGVHVTNDLARLLSTSLREAERLKTLYGDLQFSPDDEREMLPVPLVGEEESCIAKVPRSMVVSIIRPRLEETLEMVRERLERFGLWRIAGNRVVLTGGGCQLGGVLEFAGQVLGKQVRLGRPWALRGLPTSAHSPALATAAGLLSWAVAPPLWRHGYIRHMARNRPASQMASDMIVGNRTYNKRPYVHLITSAWSRGKAYAFGLSRFAQPPARSEDRAGPGPIVPFRQPQRGVLPLLEVGWRLPPLSLLKRPPARAMSGPSEEVLQANARLLETVLADYGVQGNIVEIRPGPVVTLYELEPAPGIRSARVIGLADDVARSLSVTAVRIATVPGRNVIGIEVPNARRETVFLSEILASDELQKHPGRLTLALGKDISGAAIVADLARMPHLMIAGTTGSGKSVGVNAMILSLLYRLAPDQCRLILIDPKMLELSMYEGIPHLMAPVVTELAKAVTALKWTVREMERRYRAMSQLGVRNIGGYNDSVAEARAKGEVVTRRVQTGFDPDTGRPTFEEQPLSLEAMPLIVVVVDEMADLMMVAGKEIEAAVQRLAQMARAAGIHVIMATQQPSVDVITGTIKANFPTRISFQVISKFDGHTILGEQGAEQLLGMGDMLFRQGGGRITRVHGPFVSDDEVEKVVAFLREQGEPGYVEEVTEPANEDGGVTLSGLGISGDGEKGLYEQAVAVVVREGKASTSFIQRHLNIGYNRAAKLIEQMEKEGIVGPTDNRGKRDTLIHRSPNALGVPPALPGRQ